MKRRIISLLLIVSLCLTSVVSALANELSFPDSSSIQHLEAVQTLVGDGVIQGYPDGSFRPDGTLTRAEACTILTRILRGTPSGSVPFDDVPDGHWASGYIAYCYDRGIVSGYDESKFGPNDTLLGSQWSKMLLVALGYDAESIGMLGTSWSAGVAALASVENLYDGIENFDAELPVSRDSACQIAYNGIYDQQEPSEPPANLGYSETLSRLTYSFSNTADGFKYPDDYYIPYERYQMIFGDTEEALDNYEREKDKSWAGNCYGMSSTSAMFYQKNNGINTALFSSGASTPKGLSLSDKYPLWNISLREFIESTHVSQFKSTIQADYRNNRDLNALCNAVKEFERSGSNPVMIAIFGLSGGHAVLGYGIEDIDDSTSYLRIYDCNYPDDSSRYITLTRDGNEYTGWKYHLGYDSRGREVTWGSDFIGGRISFIPYSDFYEVWSNRVQKTASAMELLTTNMNITIRDTQGNAIADVSDGEVTAYRDDVYELIDIGLRLDEDTSEPKTTSVWIPVDTYSIQNAEAGTSNENMEVKITHVDQSAKIITNADTVTFTVDDETRTRLISLDGAEMGSSYTITVRSSFDLENEPEEMTLTGTVSADGLTFGQDEGERVTDGVDLNKDELIVDGEKISPTPTTPGTPVASGTCGDNLTWTLTDDGTLTIHGTGRMDDYSAEYNSMPSPWYDYRKQINIVSIGDGVTSIGEWAFNWLEGMTSVTIPDSVTSIGAHAFRECHSLTSVTIPDGVTSIELSTFAGCNSLTSMIIPDGVTTIDGYAFSSCHSLTSVTIPDSVISIGGRAFEYCRSLTDVYYRGSESQWEQITISNDFNLNDSLINATIHYNSTGR